LQNFKARGLAGLTVATLFAAAAAHPALASTPQDTIYACIDQKTGAARIGDGKGGLLTAKSVCAKTEYRDTVAWNVIGPAGPQGPQGAKGDTGDTRALGETGGDWSHGRDRATGATGATGAKGDKGDTGETGAPAPKGDTGATGAQGEKGETGHG
jgi:hypothetical protein